MAEAARVRFESELGLDLGSPLARAAKRPDRIPLDGIRLTVHRNLGAVEQAWRAFERQADCTVFQTFAWLSTWHSHIGLRKGVRPVIVTGTGADGRLLFLQPPRPPV